MSHKGRFYLYALMGGKISFSWLCKGTSLYASERTNVAGKLFAQMADHLLANFKYKVIFTFLGK